ncbi:hypothetical protein [uncultured Mediterranean phage uvMED]|nr:hypothetical protein [uncultured Mediterranean phage uvMED]
MGHYAFINSDNIVVEVITGKNEDEALPNGFDSWEAYYETKRDGLTCKRTSYNTYDNVYIDNSTGENHSDQSKKFRGNYAGIGSIYKPSEDIFTPPKPFDSWVYDESIGNLGNWKPPIDYPTVEDDETYRWNEEEVGWDIFEWNSTTEIWELKE